MKNIVITLFLFAVPLGSTAQSSLALWSGVEVEKKVTKKFILMLNGQARAVENVSYVQTYLGEAGLGYKLTKRLELSGYYRLIHRRKNELKEFKNRHRFYADLSYDHKFGHIKFDNRLRYQHQFRDNDGEIGFDTSYWRYKIGFAWDTKSKFTPSVSGDFFYEINGSGLDQIRPKISLDYKINKHNALGVSLFSNLDLIETDLPKTPIIGVGYKLKL